MCDQLESEPVFLDDVTTGDESWAFQYDPETKGQSSKWHISSFPRQKLTRIMKTKVKTMFIILFDKCGVVHKEFVPPGRAVKLKRPEIDDRWKLHHDKSSAFIETAYLYRIGVVT
ncbi:putative DD34D transposase [Nephila pilipes]|uniref:Putative DD34D transposase n=1 Tax=Nephila pilipes TaxID=299642 RepID=A0A8X6UBR1_NEPPI|nr:putative DD34D transposase [Nephila pilipes]